MDLDVLQRQVRDLLAFKGKMEGLMNGASDNAARASDTINELLGLKATVEKALPDIERAVAHMDALAGDVAAIRADVAPVIEWARAKQAADAQAAAREKDETPAEHHASTEAADA